MPKELNSKQAGTLNENPVNNPSVRTYTGKNQFPQSFIHPSTCSYGLVDPVCSAKCEPGDIYPYKFVTDLNTFTMKSPLKSKVNKYTAAFKVPMYAIYPRNWELMYPITNKGDDVPEDTRCYIFAKRLIEQLLSAYNEYARIEAPSNAAQYAVPLVFLLESIFSDGGIFSKFNMHLCGNVFSAYEQATAMYECFDKWFDTTFCITLKDYLSNIPSGHSHLIYYGDYDEGCPDYCVTSNEALLGTQVVGINNPCYYITFDRAIELLRSAEYRVYGHRDSNVLFPPLRLVLSDSNLPAKLNIESIVSYQLACAHFFNNPKIDYIYNAKLYRDNMEVLAVRITDGFAYYPYNGTQRFYDVFSAKYLTSEKMMKFTGFDTFEDFFLRIAFWSNLFNFQRSLRYGDYFTGAHPEPIAPGDINAPVIDGTVNALDMTRKIQMARLLNKVNISGPRIQDYLKAIFGGELPEADKDSPVRLSLEQFEITGFEVNNTGSDQLSDEDGKQNITTTNLRLDDSRYMFEAAINEPCYIIVTQYFDAHRIYSRTLDKFALHFTRFDDFIPDLQFDGDQALDTVELDCVTGEVGVPFAYNLRYMEYKQRYSYASGGFIRNLPSWAFITDNKDGAPMNRHINPDYIRSCPTEFDRFFKNLSGHSLGTRFHFITFNTNVAAPYRQMVYAPEILA